MRAAVRPESLVPRLTRFVPGCFRFRGYAATHRTAKRAMAAVARHAAELGRRLVWVGAAS